MRWKSLEKKHTPRGLFAATYDALGNVDIVVFYVDRRIETHLNLDTFEAMRLILDKSTEGYTCLSFKHGEYTLFELSQPYLGYYKRKTA